MRCTFCATGKGGFGKRARVKGNGFLYGAR
jgi:adenine C2-methylase RlmN of 23S rRNA A2503 and tRNA A37